MNAQNYPLPIHLPWKRTPLLDTQQHFVGEQLSPLSNTLRLQGNTLYL